jgi:multidrug efflux pump subunit AcrB
MAKFFIDRPVFAVVISLVIAFAGGAALMTLPIAQYPEIAPPTVEVSAVYPEANAKVVQETVAAPIEQEVNGVENMLQLTRLRDVSRLELGAKNQDTQCTLDGQPSGGLAVYQLPGSNALETADHIRDKMTKLAETLTGFKSGVRYAIVYDTTPFIEQSVDEVFHALRDAIILVAIVVLENIEVWLAKGQDARRGQSTR